MVRVIVTGTRAFRDYRILRDALDLLLRDRLPDVEIRTGPGNDPLTAPYVRARHLPHVDYHTEFDRHPGENAALAARIAELVRDADAAAVVYSPGDWQTDHLIAAC